MLQVGEVGRGLSSEKRALISIITLQAVALTATEISWILLSPRVFSKPPGAGS